MSAPSGPSGSGPYGYPDNVIDPNLSDYLPAGYATSGAEAPLVHHDEPGQLVQETLRDHFDRSTRTSTAQLPSAIIGSQDLIAHHSKGNCPDYQQYPATDLGTLPEQLREARRVPDAHHSYDSSNQQPTTNKRTFQQMLAIQKAPDAYPRFENEESGIEELGIEHSRAQHPVDALTTSQPHDHRHNEARLQMRQLNPTGSVANLGPTQVCKYRRAGYFDGEIWNLENKPAVFWQMEPDMPCFDPVDDLLDENGDPVRDSKGKVFRDYPPLPRRLPHYPRSHLDDIQMWELQYYGDRVHRDFRNRDMSLRAGFTFVKREMNQSNMRKRRIRRIHHIFPWFGQYETPNCLYTLCLELMTPEQIRLNTSAEIIPGKGLKKGQEVDKDGNQRY